MKTRLKELLKEKGLTQKELANKIGVTEITLTRFKKGSFSPSLLENIANALGVSVGALFEDNQSNDLSLMETHKIKELLKEKGLTQGDLANLLGVSTQSVRQTLNANSITLATLRKVATALNVPLGRLFVSPTDMNTYVPSDEEITNNDLRIKQICHERGLTQKELAKMVGISSVGLSKAINGNTTIATLRKIASALNVPISYLFNDERNKEQIVCPKCGTPLVIRLEEKK